MIRMRNKQHGGMQFSGVWFTSSEAKLVFALMFREYTTSEQFWDILWPGPDDTPDTFQSLLRQYVWRVKKKIEPLGWTIEWHERIIGKQLRETVIIYWLEEIK